MEICAIILAAGKGSRMKSESHKGTHKICGKEMINIIIDKLLYCGIKDINVVVGEYREGLIKCIGDRGVSYSCQEEQLGTGHAVICARDFLEHKKGNVLVFACDMPLLDEESIKSLIDVHLSEDNSATLITTHVKDPLRYGRIIRENGKIKCIREAKDCSPEELNINEINSSIYCFKIEDLLSGVDKIDNKNNQNEFYLTDVIEIFNSINKKVGSINIDEDQIIGVDSRKQLCIANDKLKLKINDKHMDNGVTIIDRNSTYIDLDVTIENDVVIHPNVYIMGKTVIKKGCEILPNSRISNSVIGKQSKIESSVILDSVIGEDTSVGPFAYIRPNSNIGNNVKIGDFVEIKNSSIGNNTKISHLSYVGDSSVGDRCNLGCGIVTVNYDGKHKHNTVIEDDCFIGCNANLIAPVTIEKNAYVAAGTTITEKVSSNSLAIGRCKQTNKENWVTKK